MICNSWYWLNGVRQCSLHGTTGCPLGVGVTCGLILPVETIDETAPLKAEIERLKAIISKQDEILELSRKHGNINDNEIVKSISVFELELVKLKQQ